MNPHNISCISSVTSSQDQMILNFSLTTTPQPFHHFEITHSGLIGDPSAYFTIILIMPYCILFKDIIPFRCLFLGLGYFSCVTKALSSWSWGNICWAHRHGGGFYQKRLRESVTVLQLYKLEYLVSNDRILVILKCNLGPRCLMLIAFYCTEDEGVKEIHTCPNLLHSCFPPWETHIESLHSQDPTSGYQQTDVRQILFANKNQNWKKRLFSVRVAELMAF
jgi:hypothetical protein